MVNLYERVNGNGAVDNNCYHYYYRTPYSLSWLDLRVFYVRISKCEINDNSTPEYLTLNHVQLNPDTLLEVNGVRTGIYSDAASVLLRRDRVDKRSEEVTFVSTESIRTTGSVKFEVFRKDSLMLSGTLELCTSSNGFVGESRHQKEHQCWNISCESDFTSNAGFLKGIGKHDSGSPASVVEVYVAGCFSGRPIILTNAPQLGNSHRRKPINKGMLESIPEYEGSESQEEDSSGFMMKVAEQPENEEYDDGHHYYPMMEYLEGEEEDGGELSSWFNAGLRVGVGIGVSVCLGIGIGIGLVVKAYQGTTRNFRRRRQRRLFYF